MTYVTTDYKLASGYNNAGGLVSFTSITDGTNTLVEPHGLPFANRGRRETRTNGLVTRTGFPRVTLRSDLLYTQWLYIINNYEGFVTVRLPYNSTTWANFNAVLTMPDPEEMDYVVFAGGFDQHNFYGPGFRDVAWAFTRLVSL